MTDKTAKSLACAFAALTLLYHSKTRAQIPSVSIAVSRVMVTQNVEVGHSYVLESSFDMVTWAEAGPQFTADSESIETEFKVDVAGRYFRLLDLGAGNTNPPIEGSFVLSELGMKLLPIPSGIFTMGSPINEIGRSSDEGPVTTVIISKPFWLGETEVTQEQWQAVMGNNPSEHGGDVNLPVETVRWYDAIEFCEKLNQIYESSLPSGYRYTLPSEAQWEYACRAGTRTRFYYGDDPGYGELEQYAWYGDNGGQKTHRVGQKTPNAWGLYDMHGNVWEWCFDYRSSSYSGGNVTDPLGLSSGANRVYRGGSWQSDGPGCRSANRSGFSPNAVNPNRGFRVAVSKAPSA